MRHDGSGSSLAAWVLGVALLAGCDGGSVETDPSALEPSERDAAVQEAVIRHMLAEWGPSEEPVCLVVGYGDRTGAEREPRDPELEFLRRLRSEGRILAPGSECMLEGPDVDPDARTRHVPSGRDAVRFSVATPTWHGADSAEVSASWHRALLIGRVCTYDVGWDAGRWVVGPCRDEIAI